MQRKPRKPTFWSFYGVYSMHCIAFMVFCFAGFYVKFLKGALSVTLILGVYLIFEFSFNQNLEYLLTDKNFHFPKKSFNVIGISILLFIFYFFHEMYKKIPYLEDRDKVDILIIYARSFIASAAIIIIFLAVRMFFISLGVINPNMIQRGLFAILYRMFILIRTVYVNKYWIWLFESCSSITFYDILFRQSKFLTKLYMLGKMVYILALLWDLDANRKSYLKDKIIRHKCTDEGSIASIIRIDLCSDLFCPKCEKPFFELPKISFANGGVELYSLFFCF